MSLKKVTLYADGACTHNPGGPGGYGILLRYGKVEKTFSGAVKETTNNRMELTGIIKGLQLLKEPCEVTVFTDSQYVVNGINKGWAKSWRRNNWIKSNGEKVANPDLWEELLNLLKIHDVKFNWVKGHAGHRENEICDSLATHEADKIANDDLSNYITEF